MVGFFFTVGCILSLAAMVVFMVAGSVLGDILGACLLVVVAILWTGAAILNELQGHRKIMLAPSLGVPPVLDESQIERQHKDAVRSRHEGYIRPTN